MIFGKLHLFVGVDGDPVNCTALSEDVSGSLSSRLSHHSSIDSVRSKPSSSRLASRPRNRGSPRPVQNTIDVSSPAVDAILSPIHGGHTVPSPRSSATAQLIEALNEAEGQIKGFLSKSEFEATKDHLGREIGDPRLVDLKMGNKPSHQVIFRRGLCQRSLGLEYEQWELRNHRSSKISELMQHSPISNKNGLIQAYLKSTDYPFEYHPTISKGLEDRSKAGLSLPTTKRLHRKGSAQG